MSAVPDRFGIEDLEGAIAARASACGITLDPTACGALAMHARSVLAANERLHLTTIEVPEEFLERHIGEAFEGAALIAPELEGVHVDLGTGGGYPAIPFLVARPALRSFLVEASHKKAEFLRRAASACGLGDRVVVVERQIQRAADLTEVERIRVLTIRAVGGWAKLVPKVASLLADDGVALIWAGAEVDTIRNREVWKKLDLVKRQSLPTMERAAIWEFRRVPSNG